MNIDIRVGGDKISAREIKWMKSARQKIKWIKSAREKIKWIKVGPIGSAKTKNKNAFSFSPTLSPSNRVRVGEIINSWLA